MTSAGAEPARTPPASAPGAVASWPDANAANALLGRGVNVVVRWSYYGRGDIDAAVAAPIVEAGGFTSVRLFVDFNDALSPGFELDPAMVTELRAVVAQFTDRGLAVSINYDGSIVSVDRFVAVWRSIAAQLADLPPLVFFELANEPLWHHVPGNPRPDFSQQNVIHAVDWNAIVAGAVPAIRESNAERTIIVTSPNISFPQSVSQLVLPADTSHLIVTFHQYQPLTSTGPGFGAPVPWSGTPAEVAAMRATMNDAVCFARRHQVPLYMSEFATAEPVDLASRVAWTTTARILAEGEGISWAYFELASVGYGIWDTTTQQWRHPLYDTLMPPPGSPRPAPWAVCPAAATTSTTAVAPTTTATPALRVSTPADAVTALPTFAG